MENVKKVSRERASAPFPILMLFLPAKAGLRIVGVVLVVVVLVVLVVVVGTDFQK